MRIKNQRRRAGIRSRSLNVRVRDEERVALQEFAASLGQTPSRVLRRLLREAITGGPDYFKDELHDVRRMSGELNAIGRNLNQLTKAVNQGEWPDGELMRRVVNAARVEVAAVGERFDQAVEAIRGRTVKALSKEKGQEAGA